MAPTPAADKRPLDALRSPVSKRLLDPAERSSEVLFGLIMVLAFTGSISVATAGREEIRELLVGALGCNLAWGIVDAVMYISGSFTARQREALVHRRFVAASTPADARLIAPDILSEPVASALTGDELERIRQRLAAQVVSPARLSGRDFAAGAAVFAWVFFCTLPVVFPFVIMREAGTALRISNAIAIVMLYLAGHSMSRFTGGRGWVMGVSMVGLGMALVAVTIALGG